MNGRSQIQGCKNRILLKEINATGSSETLIGWKSGKNTFVTLWDRMEGAWLWTLSHLLDSEFYCLLLFLHDMFRKGNPCVLVRELHLYRYRSPLPPIHACTVAGSIQMENEKIPLTPSPPE